MPPARDTRPKVGRRPVVPQRWLGEVIEPSVSVPMENPHRAAAVAEAEPALDPLGEDPWADLWFYSNPIFLETR
jgi:hypothetical protein